ncbi:hypothetical protein OUZ56_024446 [Daphnia magna]|uniref:Secreted protein n=1 Tax=Daphnia magna TaxID=35525 RepID=A0ABR0B141_9CRUS|nr:hypothetical protein OUZ56_024446 [Daphnia magna]
MKTAFASRLTVTLLFSVCYCDILDTPSTGRMSSALVAWFLSPSQDGLTRQNTTYLTGSKEFTGGVDGVMDTSGQGWLPVNIYVVVNGVGVAFLSVTLEIGA